MSLLYAAIYQFASEDQGNASESKVLLGEGPHSSQLSSVVSKKLLPLCLYSSDDQKQTISHGPVQFMYVVSRKIIYVVAAEKSVKQRVLSQFLQVFEEKFSCISDRRSSSKISKFIMACLKQYNDDPSGMDKIAQLEDKMETIKDSMMENIDKVLKRGERLEKLQGDADDLEDISAEFRKDTRSVKRRTIANSCVLL
ncbi:hypothetical protein FDP41_001496 [Naegleria fowleri]|uniref:V-SNARE coiled-coil homology domain-containing protein n=1 Tax=Naegleria fowleri TaxID=5763 RepID=A0A6A5BMB5_NAEFO|nr:uncharacterized protein FDP41_001496 [Naegleria fowleri]KAF0979153.1 hypothetical protein FDP41_001496 [Naegleria fowleri]CAG4715885.1 unnamed protein product [Naegleria fowleri]